MKKIYKTISLLFLCAVIVVLPTLLIACNKDIDIKRFYGEYTAENAENDYCMVTFLPRGEDKDFEFFHGGYEIISVGTNKFVYKDINNHYQPVDKICDALLLKSLKRLMRLMGETATLRDGMIYFNDSGWDIKYDTVFYGNGNNLTLYQNHVAVSKVIWPVYAEDQTKDQVLVRLHDDYVVDEHGVEWEIMVVRRFIKN